VKDQLPAVGEVLTFESIPGRWRSGVKSGGSGVRCVPLEPLDDEARAFLIGPVRWNKRKAK
jgi:hypothetical protein